MVKFLIVDTREKFLFVKVHKNTLDGVNFIRKLSHIPPQSRRLSILLYEFDPYVNVKHIRDVEMYYKKQGLTKDMIDLYRNYPIYNYRTQEVIRPCKTKN